LDPNTWTKMCEDAFSLAKRHPNAKVEMDRYDGGYRLFIVMGPQNWLFFLWDEGQGCWVEG